MADDPDDLADFFDEIEEAEAEVAEKGEETGVADAESDGKTNGDGAITTDVNAATDEKNDDSVDPPPAKRVRVAAASAPARPRGAVVAASAASSSSISSKKTAQSQSTAAPPPPPPPPPQQSTYHNNHPYNHQPMHSQQQSQLPPLPPGPMPPPLPVATAEETKKGKPVQRMAAGKAWVDDSLADWPENDFRIFVGNLGGDVSDGFFDEYFRSRYQSVAKTKIVRDHSKDPPVSKGYGFVSFLQPLECAKAIREQDQAWVGSRPVRVKRSDWQDRNKKNVQKKNRKEAKQQKRFQSGRRF